MNIEKYIDKKKYPKEVKEKMPKSKTLSECIRAFLVGGAICTFGELLKNIYIEFCHLPLDDASCLVSISLIVIGAVLTGLGVYDVIGKFAGAGSIVPISGYSNSIVSPALEFKREGYILGTCAKLFTIAGPVLVSGISSSVLVGFIYYLAEVL